MRKNTVTKPSTTTAPQDERYGPFILRIFGTGERVDCSIHRAQESFHDAGEELTEDSPLSEVLLTREELSDVVPLRAYLFDSKRVARDVPVALVDRIRKDLGHYSEPRQVAA